MLIYFIIAALIVMLDQVVKYFITLNLAPGTVVPLVPGVLHLTYVENTGAAFSFLRGMPWLLVVVSGIVILALIVGMIKYRDKIDPIGKLALAAILGGAVSHVIDRAVLGYVVDYLEFDFVRFAIMDLADWFITVGGVVFCIWYLIRSSKHDGLREEFMLGKKKKPEPVSGPDHLKEDHSDDAHSDDDHSEDDHSDGETPEDDGEADKM